MTMTDYVIPSTALTDRGFVDDCPKMKPGVARCKHDRDGSDHETEAEYLDMCAMRGGRYEEGSALAVLAHHQQMIVDHREAMAQAEIDAWMQDHPLTASGDQPAYLMHPFTKADLHTPDYGVKEGPTGEWVPAYETPLQQRDAVRLPYLLKTIEDQHDDEHGDDQRHPFCGVCRRGGSWDAGSSLAWWLAGHPGETPARGEHRIEEPTTKKVYLNYRDLADFPEPTWLIPNLVPDQSVGYLMGRDGTYKTFLALWFAMHLIRQGKPVLFIAGEGVRSFRKRIDAWLEHHGVEMTDEMVDLLDIRSQTVDLFEAGEDYRDMVKRAEHQQYALIVVDTLARSSGAAEQNSNSDMNLITQRVDRLKHASGSTVLVVAHTDKGDNGIRGASAIGDNGDFRLLMKRKDDDVTLSIDKMKDADDDFTKRLSVLEVGESIVLIPAEEKPEPTEPVEGSHTTRNRILVALAQVHSLDYVPATTIRQIMAEDAVGDVNPGSVWRDLDRLVKEGIVLKNVSTKAYRLNADDATAQRYLGAQA